LEDSPELITGAKRVAYRHQTGTKNNSNTMNQSELEGLIRRVMREELGTMITQIKGEIRQETLDSVQPQLQELNKEYDTLKRLTNDLIRRTNQLEADKCQMQKEIDQLKQDRNDDQQYARKQFLIISGVPPRANEDTYAVVQQVIGKLGVQVREWEVSAAHRLPKRPNGDEPIILKIHNLRTKELILKKSRELKLTADIFGGNKETKLFIDMQLTQNNKMLLRMAREKLFNIGYRFVWVRSDKHSKK